MSVASGLGKHSGMFGMQNMYIYTFFGIGSVTSLWALMSARVGRLVSVGCGRLFGRLAG